MIKKSDFTSQSNNCSVTSTIHVCDMSIGNTICELIKSCCKMITWNKASLNNFFVSPPSLMDFGWIWLSCEERREKLEWFSINYRKTFLLNLTIHCFLSFFHSKMISGKQPCKRGKANKIGIKNLHFSSSNIRMERHSGWTWQEIRLNQGCSL